ncbi:hypothetical protein PMI02_01900 [Novosphingobium sp. AP12]|nr:hypothetical protein PMI02_01900 [Novosphingobium sp. AP12]
MPKTLSERVADLESAALKSEGAQFAVHDLLARLLVRLPEPEVRKMIGELIEHADELDGQLGADRRSLQLANGNGGNQSGLGAAPSLVS